VAGGSGYKGGGVRTGLPGFKDNEPVSNSATSNTARQVGLSNITGQGMSWRVVIGQASEING